MLCTNIMNNMYISDFHTVYSMFAYPQTLWYNVFVYLPPNYSPAIPFSCFRLLVQKSGNPN